MKKNMGKNNNDYAAIIGAVIVFTFLFFGSDYWGLPNWSKYILCGLGGVIGYFSVPLLTKLSITVKVMIGILFVVFILVIVYQYGNKALYDKEKLYGTWITDDSENLIIKFRVIDDSLFISQSPEYVEKVYGYVLDNDSLIVYRNDEDKEVVFKWKLTMPDTGKIQLHEQDETLVFRRVKK